MKKLSIYWQEKISKTEMYTERCWPVYIVYATFCVKKRREIGKCIAQWNRKLTCKGNTLHDLSLLEMKCCPQTKDKNRNLWMNTNYAIYWAYTDLKKDKTLILLKTLLANAMKKYTMSSLFLCIDLPWSEKQEIKHEPCSE